MILAENEKLSEMPNDVKYDFVRGSRGWEELFAVLGNGLVIPVLADEVSGTCMVCDLNGTPLRVIEPSLLG